MKNTVISIEQRQRLISRAGIIALFGNLFLAIAKLFVGFITGSLSVLGDGIDTTTDVIIACMTLVIGKIISRPSDKSHPWGHGRAETMGTLALSFVIFFAGFQLAISAIQQLNSQTSSAEISSLAIIITCISIITKIVLAISQLILGKMANSSMVKANAQNMINDIVISGSVLLGLIISYMFSSPLIDPLVALIVSIWIIKNAVLIFWEMNTELMDGNQNSDIYKELFNAVRTVKGVANPHRVRMRKIANYWDIDLDIEVPADMSVLDAHEISEKVTAAIRLAIPDIYDIMVHIEPEGLSEKHVVEAYGLSEKDL